MANGKWQMGEKEAEAEAEADDGIMKENFFDGDLGRVWCVAMAATGINFTQVNAALTSVVLVGTIIYTWRKALRRGRRDVKRRPHGRGHEHF